MSEAAALAAFNLYIGAMSARTHYGPDVKTTTKSRHALVGLFLAKHPEFADYRKALEIGDDILVSIEAFENSERD